jgi:hypothetical protein
VVKSSILNQFGFNRILEPFIADMKRLTNGQLFTVNGQPVCVFGSLLLFFADIGSSSAGWV